MTKTTNQDVIDNLTKEQLDLAYRKRERQYHIEDARQQVHEYLSSNDVAFEFTDGDYEVIAEIFEDNHDCNIADNDQWQYIIHNYIEEKMTKKFIIFPSFGNMIPDVIQNILSEHPGWEGRYCDEINKLLEQSKQNTVPENIKKLTGEELEQFFKDHKDMLFPAKEFGYNDNTYLGWCTGDLKHPLFGIQGIGSIETITLTGKKFMISIYDGAESIKYIPEYKDLDPCGLVEEYYE